MRAQFRTGQSVLIKQGSNQPATVCEVLVPQSKREPMNALSEVRYTLEYFDGSRSDSGKYAEGELMPIGEKLDLSLAMYEGIGRKVLAIKSLDESLYIEGTKVIVLEGLEVQRIGFENGFPVTSKQLCYRIIDFSKEWGDNLYNTAYKVYAYGMVIVSPPTRWDAHTVLVNDKMEEVLVSADDIPF